MTTSARDRRVPAYAATPTRALPVNQRSFSDAVGRCVYVIVGVGNYSCFYLVVHYTLRIVLATIDGDDSVHSRPNVSDQFDDLSCRTVKIEAWARYVFRHLTMKASRLVVALVHRDGVCQYQYGIWSKFSCFLSNAFMIGKISFNCQLLSTSLLLLRVPNV